MARVVDENFETPGYEESWTESGTGSGLTIDDAAAIPGTKPNGSGDYCCQIAKTASGGAGPGTIRDYGSGITTAYTRFYCRPVSWSIPSVGAMTIAQGRTSGGTLCWLVRVQNNGGTYTFEFLYQAGGWQFATNRIAAATGNWYRHEVYYTASAWGWRVYNASDENTDLSNQGGSATMDYGPIQQLNITLRADDSNEATMTMCFDLVAIDNATWVGAEAGPAGVSKPILMNYYRNRQRS